MEAILRQIFTVEGVTGALLASKDGLTIASVMDIPTTEAHAAHAATAFDALERYTRQVALGKPRQAVIETGSAVLILTEAGNMILVVSAHAAANLGRLRLESARMAHALEAQMRG
jgi:predicted regulator of Ras-like GTPase activity (Roadblock/LC7/MglB family)